MVKRFVVLVVLLVTMLATVMPAVAQEPPPFSVTGVVEDLGSGVGGSSPYSIDPAPHDEEPNGIYLAGDLNFGAFVGEWVTAYSTPEDVGGFRILHVTRIEPAEPETATLRFELAVACEPPADAQFLGFTALESLITAPLTDPDGDGLYTGSLTLPRFPPGPRFGQREPISLSPVRIVQGPPTAVTALGPQFRVIKDFGTVTLDRDKTLMASVSFCNDDGGNGTLPETGVAEDFPPLIGLALTLISAGLLSRSALRRRRSP